MNNVYAGFVDCFGKSLSLSQSSEHLVSDVLPVVDDNKLILRAFEGVHKSVLLSIESILKFEHLFKRINLTNSRQTNLKLFFDRCSERYGISDEDKSILREVILLGKKHKEAGFEFSKYRKVIIMQDSGQISEIGVESIKKYSAASRKMAENGLKELYKAF